jgi:MraZ protein
MRTTVLYGEFDLAIDEKNRLSIPSEVRKSLDPERDGDKFFLIVGVNKWLWLYPDRSYETMVSKLASEMAPGEDMLDFDQMNFAMADRQKWDDQGRMQIPPKIVRRTGLSKEVTLIGVRDHLELWNRADWEAHSQRLIARRAEISTRAKQAQQVKPAAQTN